MTFQISLLHIPLALDYPAPWVMMLATVGMLVLIFGGGIWFQNAEKKYRQKYPNGDPAEIEYIKALEYAEEEDRKKAEVETSKAALNHEPIKESTSQK